MSRKANLKTVVQLRAVLDRIAEAYFAIDEGGRLLELNEAAEAKIFQRPAADLLGKILWEEYPSFAEGGLRQHFQTAIGSGRDLHFETNIPKEGLRFEVHALPGDGRLELYLREITGLNEIEIALRVGSVERPLDFRRVFAIRARFQRAIFKANQRFTTTNARLSAGNKLLGQRNRRLGEELEKRNLLLEALQRQKKQLDEQNELLSIIFETNPAGIAVVSGGPELTFRYANPAYRQLTPNPKLDPIGRSLDEVWTPEKGYQTRQAIEQVLESGEAVRFSNYELVLPDGARRFYDITLHFLDWEAQPAVLAMLWEMTSLREAQTRAEQAAAQAKDYAARLEAANRELRSFAFIASHDLQEPLRKIQVFGDRLAAHSSGMLDETSRVFLERMQNAAHRMQEMITGLLAYSRVSTHNLPFKPTDLSQVAREVLSDLEVSVESSGAQVQLGELPVIEADPLQMRQLLQNLIGNALKFHRPGIPPQIQITTSQVNSERIQLEIADNGIGFDPRNAALLFQPFARLHGRLYEGTGMGLAICRKTVERHQGSIAVESSPGQGSTFYITLPVVQIKQPE